MTFKNRGPSGASDPEKTPQPQFQPVGPMTPQEAFEILAGQYIALADLLGSRAVVIRVCSGHGDGPDRYCHSAIDGNMRDQRSFAEVTIHFLKKIVDIALEAPPELKLDIDPEPFKKLLAIATEIFPEISTRTPPPNSEH